MVVDVYAGGVEQAPESLNFDAPPKVGDMVALDGAYFEVTGAWHKPGDRPFEPKFAILLARNDVSELPMTPRAATLAEASNEENPR